jgi:hypothetical protein
MLWLRKTYDIKAPAKSDDAETMRQSIRSPVTGSV